MRLSNTTLRPNLLALSLALALSSLSGLSQVAHAQTANTSNATASMAQESPAQILAILERAATWQLNNPSRHPETDWTQGAGYAGIMAVAGISGDSKFRDAMIERGNHIGWKLGPRVYHADDHTVGQMYAELYLLNRNPTLIAQMKRQFDDILADPKDGTLQWHTPNVQDRWSWCDALFMSPPAFARLSRMTGDPRYLDFAIKQWWKTSDYLYDKEEQLYFRDSRYFNTKELNGKKVFWGRGNGWVMGGLARMLQYIPDNHPERAKFVKQFQEMAAKIKTLQQSDGMWRSSLLDPVNYPLKETSSTGFYTYALIFGINQGLLNRDEYAPVVRKAWESLTQSVDANGRLTHVQPIGEDPRSFNQDATEIYGVGAFLLAGSEYYRFAVTQQAGVRQVSVHNPSTIYRHEETVEVDNSSDVVVMNSQTSTIIPSQQVEGKLIFQTSIAPHEKQQFLVIPKSSVVATPPIMKRVHARFVPERLDDFAWENDRVAHRVYGPALMSDKKEKLTSSGVDVWAKRTRNLIVDKWYRSANYHEDQGEGLDFYKVGEMRGCGGIALREGNKFYTSKNYSKWRVLANGPIRAVFELNYDKWQGTTQSVAEIRRITLDAGSHFNRVESRFVGATKPIEIAVGIAHHDEDGVYRETRNWSSYWGPSDPKHGSIACAIVLPTANKLNDGQHYWSISPTRPSSNANSNFTYYFGSTWSKGLDHSDVSSWENHVAEFYAKLASPLKVEVRN